MIFREKEGVTLIIEKNKIDETIPFTFECFQITLNIHSSLEAVGFLRWTIFYRGFDLFTMDHGRFHFITILYHIFSAISKLLTEEGISSNCVAGYYHDHLFIKVGDEQRVMSWGFWCNNSLQAFTDNIVVITSLMKNPFRRILTQDFST